MLNEPIDKSLDAPATLKYLKIAYFIEEILHISSFGNDFDNEKIYKIPTEIKKNKEIKELFQQHEGINKVNRIDYRKFEFLGYFTHKGTNKLVYRYGDSYFLESKSPKKGAGATLEYYSGVRYTQELGKEVKFIQKRKND